MTRYDVVIVGAGQAGVPLAREFARAGRRTALIEREHVGGTCINEGCTPTKTMVASARVAYLAKRAADFGLAMPGEPTTDMAAIRRRKREIVDRFRRGSEDRLNRIDGLDLIKGTAAFSGPHTLTVSVPGTATRSITGDLIFINAGARPSLPDIPGIAAVPVLDSTSIMELAELPEHLMVLGGGYIGLEFGQMFRRFGSRVTIVQRNTQLLPREDPDIAEAVREILLDDGVEVLLGSEVAEVTGGERGVSLCVRTGPDTGSLRGSHLLAAIGRRPNSDRLNLAAAGIATGRGGFVTVNERLETNVPGVYALGDINGGPSFTHVSYDDFRIIRTNLLEQGRATTRERMVPYTVYMDPQLGRVGLTEEEARAQGRNIRVARLPMTSVARALEMAETRGFMKAVIEAETDQILGCAVLGIEGGEIMSMIQLAMMGKLPASRLGNGVFAHPSLAESLNNLFT